MQRSNVRAQRLLVLCRERGLASLRRLLRGACPSCCPRPASAHPTGSQARPCSSRCSRAHRGARRTTPELGETLAGPFLVAPSLFDSPLTVGFLRRTRSDRIRRRDASITSPAVRQPPRHAYANDVRRCRDDGSVIAAESRMGSLREAGTPYERFGPPRFSRPRTLLSRVGQDHAVRHQVDSPSSLVLIDSRLLRRFSLRTLGGSAARGMPPACCVSALFCSPTSSACRNDLGTQATRRHDKQGASRERHAREPKES